MDDLPLVSIGMPIYNEGKYIKHSLDCLVQQTYQNIEIIISDNCSSDNTKEICRGYADKYNHISYHRLSINTGIAENFRYTQKNAKGKYFMWASGHDLWSDNLISECVNELERSKNGVISFASSCWIDESGELLNNCTGWTDTRGMHAVERFFTIMWGNMHPILGLIKNSSLNEIEEFKGMLGADLLMLCDLSLRGDFIHAKNALWSRRTFRNSEDYQQRISRYKNKEYNLLEKSWKNIFPIIYLPFEICKVVIKSTLRLHIKILVLIALMPTMLIKYLVSR